MEQPWYIGWEIDSKHFQALFDSEAIYCRSSKSASISVLSELSNNRRPRYKGGYQGEMERPSPSYIVDVSYLKTFDFTADVNRCYHHSQDLITLQTQYQHATYIPHWTRSSTQWTWWNGPQKAGGSSQDQAVESSRCGTERDLTSKLSCKHMM